MLGLAATGLGCGIARPEAGNPGPHACADFLSRTGFLCPYPEVARYTGSGDLDDAASFVCRPPAS